VALRHLLVDGGKPSTDSPMSTSGGLARKDQREPHAQLLGSILRYELLEVRQQVIESKAKGWVSPTSTSGSLAGKNQRVPLAQLLGSMLQYERLEVCQQLIESEAEGWVLLQQLRQSLLPQI